MQILYRDRAWQLDVDEMTNRQAEAIQKYVGMTLTDWAKVLDSGDESAGFIRCLETLYWLMLRQNGEPGELGDLEFPLGKFGQAFKDGMAAAEAEAEALKAKAAPDPTLPPADSEQSPEPPSPSLKTTAGGRDG